MIKIKVLIKALKSYFREELFNKVLEHINKAKLAESLNKPPSDFGISISSLPPKVTVYSLWAQDILANNKIADFKKVKLVKLLNEMNDPKQAESFDKNLEEYYKTSSKYKYEPSKETVDNLEKRKKESEDSSKIISVWTQNGNLD